MEEFLLCLIFQLLNGSAIEIKVVIIRSLILSTQLKNRYFQPYLFKSQYFLFSLWSHVAIVAILSQLVDTFCQFVDTKYWGSHKIIQVAIFCHFVDIFCQLVAINGWGGHNLSSWWTQIVQLATQQGGVAIFSQLVAISFYLVTTVDKWVAGCAQSKLAMPCINFNQNCYQIFSNDVQQ